MIVKEESQRQAPRQAQWFPMLLSPGPLDGSMAGDVGFDPLGLAKDQATLVKMRDVSLYDIIQGTFLFIVGYCCSLFNVEW